MLIHQAFNDYYGTWRTMEEAYKAGKVRAIGVSNFYPDCFVDLALFSEIKPRVNQVETHVNADDMKAIEALDGGESLFLHHQKPETVKWFMTIL